MSAEKISINVRLLNDVLEEGCCDANFLKKMRKVYTFEYDEFTKIRDLFNFLLNNLCGSDDCFDEELTDRFAFKIKRKTVYANVDFSLKKFLEIHEIGDPYLLIYFNECVGGGNGAIINELANIRINPNESNHKELPHVHIYKTNYNQCVRIELNSFQKLKNDKYDLKDFFTKKEIDHILYILKKYQKKLIDFYNKIQNGEKPESFIIEYNKKTVWFK
ncbi:MAG: hypothetical protein IJO63_03560 [Bacilli bacterium]|nr:hypothetical protein [Bacilli bacterium]